MRCALLFAFACSPSPPRPVPPAARPPAPPAGRDLETECERDLAAWAPMQAPEPPSCEGPGGTRDPACGPEMSSSDGDPGRPICGVVAAAMVDGWSIGVLHRGPHMNLAPVACSIAIGRAHEWWLVGAAHECSLSNGRLEVRSAARIDRSRIEVRYATDGEPGTLVCALGPPIRCD